MGAYEKFKKIYDEIDLMIQDNVTNEDPKFIAWQIKTDRFIRKYFGDGLEFKDFSNTIFGLRVWSGTTTRNDKVRACREGLISTKVKFGVYLEEIEDKDNSKSTKVENGFAQEKEKYSRVFIVHGHNGELKQEVARIIEKQGIEAIILSEQANLGNTIIEKFEKYSDVSAAICLFSGDDLGKANQEELLNQRARQNVVFEAGYFIGKLGRKNVVLLANSDIEMPSDLLGVVYSNNKVWQIEVLKELDAMGYEIDMNKVF